VKLESVKVLDDLGFADWRACVLHAAIKLTVFTHIGHDQLQAEELAQRLHADLRGSELLLDTLGALGLLQKAQGRYANTAFGQTDQDDNSAHFSGCIIYQHMHMYQHWGWLDEGKTAPVLGALFALNMLVNTPGGRSKPLAK
jgi:hypothetical protein